MRRTANRRILFHHIPKTAGKCVNAALKFRYDPDKLFHINGARAELFQEGFRGLPAERQLEFECVMGHGAHELRDLVHPEMFCATLLRDPVERVVSLYHYIRRYRWHRLHDVVKDLSLIEFVESGHSAADARDHVVAAFSPSRSPAEALEVLRSYDLVGFTDQLRGFFWLLGFNPKWAVPRRNVNPHPPAPLDAGTRRLIESCNQGDIWLYETLRDLAS